MKKYLSNALLVLILLTLCCVLIKIRKPVENKYQVYLIPNLEQSTPYDRLILDKLKMRNETVCLIQKLRDVGVDVDLVLAHAIEIKKGGSK